jgi:hypothetical protein
LLAILKLVVLYLQAPALNKQGVIMKKIILATFALSLIATPALALTVPYPETIRVTSDITCPILYPIKTGSSSGGVYTTTCFSEKAWSLYLAGGDDWDAWVNGTYVEPTPEPTPTPTITVTAEPIVRTNTVVVSEIVLEPCPTIEKPKAIRKEIKRLKKMLEVQKKDKKTERTIKNSRGN